MEKVEWCGYPMVKKIVDMFIRFDIASRGKNGNGEYILALKRYVIKMRGTTKVSGQPRTVLIFAA